MALTGLATVTYAPPSVGGLRLSPELTLPISDFDEPAAPSVSNEAPSIALEHGEGTLRGARGVSLYTQWWRPCHSPYGVLLVVHGLKDHSARYGALAERLVAHGLAVHAFDLRGHARSDGPRAWVDRFDDYVDDLDAVAASVRARNGHAPLFVLGQGLGGAIATSWTLDRGPKVAGLVLSGASLQPTEAPVEARSTRLLAALAPRARIFQLDLRRASRDRGTVEDAVRDTLVQRAPAPARTAKELLDAMARIDARADQLTIPLLAMHGSADVISDEQGSRRLVQRAASADKQLYVYDGLAHDLLHEPERERVMDDLTDWIVERLGS